MTDSPNRLLTPGELQALQEQKSLNKLQSSVEERFIKQAEGPAKWFGYLLAALLIAMFIDVIGWPAAFLSGQFYYLMSLLLQAIETLCIVGLAGLGIHGTVQSYRQQRELKRVAEEHQNSLLKREG